MTRLGFSIVGGVLHVGADHQAEGCAGIDRRGIVQQAAADARAAPRPETLLSARADLLAVLASRHGEARAREEVEEVTRMFHGLLPPSLQARTPPRRR